MVDQVLYDLWQQVSLFMIQHDTWLQMNSQKNDIHGLHGVEMEQLMLVGQM